MKLFDSANEYVKQSGWIDFSLLKICLAALGTVIGLLLPTKHKKAALLISSGIFVATCIPQLRKFFRILSWQEK